MAHDRLDVRAQTRDEVAALPLAALDPAQPALFEGDAIWPIFERLREEDPVHFVNSPEFGPYWSVTRWADILAVDSDHETFSSAEGIALISKAAEENRKLRGEQSGGFILPESELGKGTTFKIFLPRYVVEDGDEAGAVRPQTIAAAKKELKATDLTGTGRVLLVEDEVEVRQFAVRALKRQGYQVLEATDGVEALEIMAANEGEIDIVVSDVVMPEMDGPALFKELRKRNPSIKVIFVSGYPNEAFRESMGSDNFAFLPKPFAAAQLFATVERALDRDRHGRDRDAEA